MQFHVTKGEDMTLRKSAAGGNSSTGATGDQQGEPNWIRREREVFLDAAVRGAKYVESLRSRRVFPSQADLDGLTRLPAVLPNGATDEKQVIELLDRFGSAGTVASGGGRYFGFVCGGALPAARAAAVLAAAWDQN